MASGKNLVVIVLRGDSRSGKTSLVNRFAKDDFQANYKATMGSDFITKDAIINGRQKTLQLWDTSGQDRFQALSTAFLRGAEVCVLVFDVNKLESFERLDYWREDFRKHKGLGEDELEDFPFIVVGNKTDCESRKITAQRAKDWCSQRNIQYFETSAKDGSGVQEAFHAAALATFGQGQQHFSSVGIGGGARRGSESSDVALQINEESSSEENTRQYTSSEEKEGMKPENVLEENEEGYWSSITTWCTLL